MSTQDRFSTLLSAGFAILLACSAQAQTKPEVTELGHGTEDHALCRQQLFLDPHQSPSAAPGSIGTMWILTSGQTPSGAIHSTLKRISSLTSWTNCSTWQSRRIAGNVRSTRN